MYNQRTEIEDIIDLKTIFQNSKLPNLQEFALLGVKTNFESAKYYLPNWFVISLVLNFMNL
jgi:hypothetical protein